MREHFALEMSTSSQRLPVGELLTGNFNMGAADSWSSVWAKARGWAAGGGAQATRSPQGYSTPEGISHITLVTTEMKTQQV